MFRFFREIACLTKLQIFCVGKRPLLSPVRFGNGPHSQSPSSSRPSCAPHSRQTILISSARAIVLRDDEVVVIQNPDQEQYIIPGGRREPGETVLETLQRELLEEIGWTVRQTAVIGAIHFQHLTPKPPDYPYPYPHFFWAIFAAQADEHFPDAVEPDAYVASSQFCSIGEVSRWQLENGQQALLQTAVQMQKR